MSTESPVRVRVSRRYTASAERVFDAWLNTDMVARWFVAPSQGQDEVVHLSVDARVGGTFSFVVRRKGQELDHTGHYIEIDRPRRLVFTWGVREAAQAAFDSSQVAIDITPLTTGCELTLTHDLHPAWAEYAARTESGWTKILGAIGQVLDQDQQAAAAAAPRG
jgi:uncharacterized protein YndB with AHSA1/START domain